MIYTIGNRPNYISSFEKTAATEGSEIFKAEGGYAVRTMEDALHLIGERYADRDMSVFGVIADWNADTTPSDDGWWHLLNKRVPIVMVESLGRQTDDLSRLWQRP